MWMSGIPPPDFQNAAARIIISGSILAIGVGSSCDNMLGPINKLRLGGSDINFIVVLVINILLLSGSLVCYLMLWQNLGPRVYCQSPASFTRVCNGFSMLGWGFGVLYLVCLSM